MLVYYEMQKQSGNINESVFKIIAIFRSSTQNDMSYSGRASLINPEKPTRAKLECSYHSKEIADIIFQQQEFGNVP